MHKENLELKLRKSNSERDTLWFVSLQIRGVRLAAHTHTCARRISPNLNDTLKGQNSGLTYDRDSMEALENIEMLN